MTIYFVGSRARVLKIEMIIYFNPYLIRKFIWKSQKRKEKGGFLGTYHVRAYLNENEFKQHVIYSPHNATNKNLKWISTNTYVATVDKNGVVKALGSGTTLISIISQDGEHYATCTIKVPYPSGGSVITPIRW